MFLKYFSLIFLAFVLFADNCLAKASIAERKPQVMSASNITRPENRVHPKTSDSNRYEPTWESLDLRPLPQWYDDAKIGQ